MLKCLDSFPMQLTVRVYSTWNSISDYVIQHSSISGNPVLFDWEGARFQGVIMETRDGDDKKREFALAVVLKDINVDAIIEKILKKKPGKLGWISKATTCKSN